MGAEIKRDGAEPNGAVAGRLSAPGPRPRTGGETTKQQRSGGESSCAALLEGMCGGGVTRCPGECEQSFDSLSQQ